MYIYLEKSTFWNSSPTGAAVNKYEKDSPNKSGNRILLCLIDLNNHPCPNHHHKSRVLYHFWGIQKN